MAERDFYKTLGVQRTATEAEIRKVYKGLARKYHPDRNPGNKQAEDRFKDATYARDVLLNKEKRALYDEFGELGLKEGFSPDTFRNMRAGQSRRGGGPNLEDLFGGLRGGGWPGNTGGFEGFGDAGRPETMEDLFSRAGRRRARPAPVELVSEMSLGFTEALRGGERQLQLSLPGDSEPRTLRVRIPPGVKDGGQIRLRAQGVEGGDVVLKMHVEEHPFFRREDDDLVLALPLTASEAYRGAKIAVPTLDGDVTLTVPPHTKSGSKLRLRGKGVKTGTGAGDLLVVVQIRLPEGDDPAIEAAVSALDAHYVESPRAGIKL